MEFGDPEFAPMDGRKSEPAGRTSEKDRSHRWVALLTGNAGLKDAPAELAREQFLDWLRQPAEGVFGNIPAFAEVFQTTRFYNEIKAIESPARFLKTVSDNLRSGSLSFYEAVDCVGRYFGWEEERYLQWKRGLENLAGFTRWLPGFAHAHEYLSAAFPLGIDKLDRLRDLLLKLIEEPHRFLESRARSEFDSRFLEFKKNYMDSYFVLHEDALYGMSGLKKEEVKVDSVALRNLELLSSLPHADQSFLNRVKLLARWIQRNQCNLPLPQILELYPRCYCNFNPRRQQQPATSAAQINALIQEGLEFFRTILRRCGHLILLEARAETVDDDSLKQITAALSDGPMIPLKVQAVKILNKVIIRNSNEFLSEIRKAQK